nr:unnamed protein product [Callosobruchus chinensis]
MCTNTEVPYPKVLDKNEICEIKIFNLYSPSRFWVVVKFESLKVFCDYLTHYYKQKKQLLKEIGKLQTCMISQMDIYYRAIILPGTFYEKDRIRVFLLDYGIFTHVTRGDIFCIETKHLQVPRFALRCCLAYIRNLDPTRPWTTPELQMFCEIIENREIFMKTFEIHVEHNTYYVDILRKCENSLESCSSLLVSSGKATFISETDNVDTETKDSDFRYKRALKYMHLFPTFQALERGDVPYSLWEHNLLKDCLPKDILYKNYYQFISRDKDFQTK